MAAYYPRKSISMGDVLKEFEKFGLAGYDEEELQRVDDVNMAKMRGKGAPKKKRTAAGKHPHLAHHVLQTVANQSNRRASGQESGWQEVMIAQMITPSLSLDTYVYYDTQHMPGELCDYAIKNRKRSLLSLDSDGDTLHRDHVARLMRQMKLGLGI